MLKKISLIIMILFYIAAGINHFWHPAGYYSIIPPYLPHPHMINIIAGIAEICGGLLLIFPATRKFAAYGIIAMLIAFMPAHIYMIQEGGILAPLWVAWLRIPLQAVLIWWAWANTKNADDR